MAKFYVNFTGTVCVNVPDIDATKLKEKLNGAHSLGDVSDLLSDDEWNDVVSEACDLMEFDGNNVDSIELIEDEDEDDE